MQNPSVSMVHVDRPLTDISIRHNNSQLVAENIFPIINVQKQSDLYYTYGMENFIEVDDEMAPGDPAREIYSTLSTDTYYCKKRGLRKKVTDEEKENADIPINPEIDATEDVTERLLLRKERRVKTLLSSGITAGHTPATKWDDLTTGGNPDYDILTAVSSIHETTLQVANTLILPFHIAVMLTTNPKIQKLVYHVQNVLTIGSAIMLPNPLWGLRVLIAGAGYCSSNPGQTTRTLSYVWGNDVYVAYVNPNPGLKRISLGYIFRWKQRQVKKIRREEEDSTLVQVTEYTDEKLVSVGCGYKIRSVKTV